MANIFSKLVNPWYPSTAIGLDQGHASLVQLERSRGGQCSLRRAATVRLPDNLIVANFDEPNIEHPVELASALRELATSAGLLQQKRWSLSLPDATSRGVIVTLESAPGSNTELEEVLRWKIERSFGAAMDELSVSRERLPADAQGRDRFLVVAVRAGVLDEYESVLASLGWRTGLVLPRHIGEGQWLTANGTNGDSLLLSSSNEGFTAVVFRGKKPLIIRTVNCDSQECEDEIYRMLLFYRDRRIGDDAEVGQTLSRLLVVGNMVNKERACEIVNETLNSNLRPLRPEDLGLHLSTRELSFDAIAAPAGLATLSWK